MRIIKDVSAISIIILVLMIPPELRSETFEQRGLRPVAIVIDDHRLETLDRVKAILDRSGAKGLNIFPPDVAFVYVPAGFSASDLDALDVRVVESADDPSLSALGGVLGGVIENLFESGTGERFGTPEETAPFNDLLFHVSPELIEVTKYAGPLKGAPSELEDRGISQNSEFLIGSVLVNIVFPESQGGSENWTDEEIAGALIEIARGCQDYQQHALWTNLTFVYNHKDYHRVPVTLEPIEGDWNSDPEWISEAMGYIGYPDGGDRLQTHLFNNDRRAEFGTDWVFTAFVADASVNECWQGPDGQYVAYAYLGGPYLLVPYPACSLGNELGFSRVFIHEMGHIFWALDEYPSAEQSCSQRSGYLDYENRNTLFNPCQAVVPCIMQGALPGSPVPICSYTIGQVGLASVDYYWGQVPEIYNVKPKAVFRETTDLSLDTVFSMPYEMGLHVWNDAVPNSNPYQFFNRIDYAAKIKNGYFWINSGLEAEMEGPPRTGWTSDNLLVHEIPSLEPGRSDISYRFENIVGLTTQITKTVYYIGIKYYFTELSPSKDHFDVTWSTTGETFGAVFDIVKEDLTAGGGEEVIGTVAEPTDFIGNRRVYDFVDEDIEPAHQYRFCVVGRFQLSIDGKLHEIRVPTGDMYEISWIPTGNDLVSYLLPNPTNAGTSITVDIPKSYYDPAGSQDNSNHTAFSTSFIEVLTPVDIGVYNIKGQKIATIYHNKLYGSTRTFQWNGTDSYGKPVAPGVYFVRVVAGDVIATKKVVIIR